MSCIKIDDSLLGRVVSFRNLENVKKVGWLRALHVDNDGFLVATLETGDGYFRSMPVDQLEKEKEEGWGDD